jgi:hypothetical protein
MDEIRDVNDTSLLAVFTRVIDMEFTTSEELTVSMAMEGTATDADPYEYVKKVLQSLDIPSRILASDE